MRSGIGFLRSLEATRVSIKNLLLCYQPRLFPDSVGEESLECHEWQGVASPSCLRFHHLPTQFVSGEHTPPWVYYCLAMYPSIPIHEMSKWEFFLNNPEWVGVFANALFAAVTIGVVTWQVRVMQWQGRNSSRHEQIQNQLLRLQHEHEWVLRLNTEREKLLKAARDLHMAASCLKEEQSNTDARNWGDVQDIADELHRRLDILDITVFTGEYDQRYASLDDYVEAVLDAVSKDYEFKETYKVKDDGSPGLTARKSLQAAAQRYKPLEIFLNMESAIRMEFFDFKKKWDAVLPS